MQKRVKRLAELSLILSFLTFFMSGVLLYSSPAFGGPDVLGVQLPVSDGNGEVVSSASEAVEEGAGGDIELAGSISNKGPLRTSLGEVNSMTKEAIPFRKATGFDVFNAQYHNQWTASFSQKTGKVKLLFDFRSREYPDGPENVAREFLRESWTLFGMKQDLSDLKVVRVDRTPARNHVKLQQTYNGIPIAGVFVLVHSNKKNQVTMVQNNYIEEFQPSNQEQLSAESAIEITRNDLRTSLGNNATFSEAKAEKLIAPYQGAYYYVWNIMISARNPLGLWLYRVDASNGQILHKSNQIRSLDGTGRVYKNNTNYFLGTTTNETLNKLLPLPSTNDTGYLFGAHTAIYNYNSLDAPPTPGPPFVNTFMYDANDPFASNLRFLYDPITELDSFHATNAYYKLNVIWNWWNQNVVSKYVNNKDYTNKKFRHYVPHFTDNYPIPTIVNDVDYAGCNAFYTPDIITNLSFQPGFVFGNENACDIDPIYLLNEDFVLDEDVVAHEFTHFIVDQCGFTGDGDQFDDTLYGTSMNEGNADFFAFLRTKNPDMGKVVWASSPLGYLRTIDNTRMYPNDVDDPGLGGPEPHYTGQIWAGYLYDLYKTFGRYGMPESKTIKYVFQGFYYFASPMSGFSAGSFAEYLAEKDINKMTPLSIKATGAEASRGLSVAVRCYDGYGPEGSWWVFPPTKSIKTKGIMQNPGNQHEYWVEVKNAVMDLTVTVTSGAAPRMTEPVISIYNISRDDFGNFILDPYTNGCASVAHITTVGHSGSGSTTTQLSWPGLGAGLYSIVVEGTGTGNYNFSLSLK